MTAPGINLALILSTAAAQRQLQQDMTNAARNAGRQASGAFNNAFTVRGIAQDVLPFAASALVSRGIGTIVKSAAEMNQALNATGQIYGQLRGEIDTFVNTQARGLGLAKKDAQDYANQFGAILRGLELSEGAAAKFSKQLISAGSSLAAFRNTSVEQAINALQAGFRGEYDSLQRFIPEVSDLTLRMRALKLGLADTKTAVTQQDKALALLDVVQKSVGRSAGEAERRQGNLQTKLQDARAASLDTATAIGQKLLPALEGTLDTVNAVGPAYLTLGAAFLLLGRRVQASSTSQAGLIAQNRAAFSSSAALTQALARQQAMTASLGFTQALANRAAIVGNNQVIAASRAVQGAVSGAGTGFSTYAGQAVGASRAASGFGRVTAGLPAALAATRAGISAVGSALGGPFTIALVAATIGIGYLVTQQNRQKEAAKRAKAENKSYAESIAEIGDSSSKAALALSAKELVERGLAARADRAGISLSLLNRAYAGQRDAIIDVNKALKERERALVAMQAEATKNGDRETFNNLSKELSALRQLQIDIGANGKALEDAANKNDLYARTVQDATQALAAANDTYVKGRDAIANYLEAEEQLFAFKNKQIDANIAYEAALDALTEGFKENGKSLDITTAKGRDNVANVRELIQAAYDQAAADIERTGTISAQTQKRIDGLRAELVAMGLNEQEIEKYIEASKRVPPEVVTQIRVMGGEDAEGKLNAIGRSALNMIAQYNLTPVQAFGLAQGRDPRAVFGKGYDGKALGGRIVGPGGPTEDKAGLFALSNDEFVVRAAAVQRADRLYGPDALEKFNRTGVFPIDGRYAAGGRIQMTHSAMPQSWRSWSELIAKANKLQADKKAELTQAQNVGGPIGGPGGGSLGGSAGMMALLRAQFPGLPLLSGYRPNSITLTGNRSYHASDRAVDVPPRRDVAEWIRANYGAGTRELITPYQELNLHNGRPHVYTGAVWNQHNFAGGNAHDHWAYDKGGVMNPGDIGANYGRQPEAVLDPEQTTRFRALTDGRTTIELGEYTIAKIMQGLQTRPAVFTVDRREIARAAFEGGRF